MIWFEFWVLTCVLKVNSNGNDLWGILNEDEKRESKENSDSLVAAE